MPTAAKQCFSASYDEARAGFLEAAARAGGVTQGHRHPLSGDPAGAPVEINVALFGRTRAPKVLLILSGTHGLEGYAGSAAQLALMRSGLLQALPPDVMVLLVHALNAWGFAHASRTTENNVDLNRNFVDWSGGAPPNPHYRTLHALLCPEDWTPESRTETGRAIADFIQRHGRSAFLDYMVRGQYEFTDGIGYGGAGPEWPQLVLTRILEEHCRAARKVAVIDWHTGVGAHGKPFFLCFNRPGSALERRCLDWWEQKASTGFSEGAERPSYTGLVYGGIERMLSHAEVAGGVVELGTRPVDEMVDALRLDRWLRFARPQARSEPPRELLRRDLIDAYCPSDEAWRASVLAHAERIHRRTLDGLITWT